MSNASPGLPETFDRAASAPVRHLPIAPTLVIAGSGAIAELGRHLRALGHSPLVLHGRAGLAACRDALFASLENAGLHWQTAELIGDCSEESLEVLSRAYPEAQVILGVGGGKVMDAAKLLGFRRDLPVVTVPTSAATCAAWTALSNVYTPDGQWRYGVLLPTGPAAVVVDHAVLAKAPARLLAAGIADTLAKWVESSASVDPQHSDAMTLAALQMARFLYDRLREIGPEAVRQARAGELGPALMQAIDANVQLAGTVGGLGGARCRSVAAHAVCNGLTQVETRRASWHGEKVGFGILVQGILQGWSWPDLEDLLAFYREIDLPHTLDALGVSNDPETLMRVARFACDPRSSIHLLPTPVTPEVLVAAIAEADRLARRTRAPHA